MTNSIAIRSLAPADIAPCATLLHSLPDWFGLDESNRAYIDSLERLPGAVAVRNDEISGFANLVEHTPRSWEINVMAVRRELHRRGVGRALIDWAESWCTERDIPWLHVKTRGPATPDPEYARTRQFYLAMGYEPLFESLTLWGEENAALILVKHLACRSTRDQGRHR